ncbi:MAG TPA: hypothetical protein VGG45_06240, partial [Terracidiphilus sp.]
ELLHSGGLSKTILLKEIEGSGTLSARRWPIFAGVLVVGLMIFGSTGNSRFLHRTQLCGDSECKSGFGDTKNWREKN